MVSFDEALKGGVQMSIDFKPEWKNLQQPYEWKIVNKLAQCRAVLEDLIFSICS